MSGVCAPYECSCLRRPKEGVGSAGATGAFEPPDVECLGSNLGPLQEQQLLLTVSHLSNLIIPFFKKEVMKTIGKFVPNFSMFEL